MCVINLKFVELDNFGSGNVKYCAILSWVKLSIDKFGSGKVESDNFGSGKFKNL